MLVRIENIRGTNSYLVIDEIDRYLGYCEDLQDFFDCTPVESKTITLDDYEYYTANKEQLLKILL